MCLVYKLLLTLFSNNVKLFLPARNDFQIKQGLYCPNASHLFCIRNVSQRESESEVSIFLCMMPNKKINNLAPI